MGRLEEGGREGGDTEKQKRWLRLYGGWGMLRRRREGGREKYVVKIKAVGLGGSSLGEGREGGRETYIRNS